MPVRSEDTTSWFVDEFETINRNDLLTAVFPSDDIWKKFEFCELPLSEFTPCGATSFITDDTELDAVLEWSLDASTSGISEDLSEIRHHDCMWAGHCGSKEHKPENVKISRPLLQTAGNPTAIMTTTTTISPKKTTSSIVQTAAAASSAGRSLLLNSRNTTIIQNKIPPVPQQQHNNNNTGPRPDSPPNSDDDDHPRFKHEITLFDSDNKTLQFLNDAISECDFDEDSDLCDYFEDSDVFGGGTESRETTPRSSYPGESDHSYHKGKGAQLRTDQLGIQTPSDSEEEIDVVSIGEKQIVNTRNCNTVLPTNPSVRDRQKLQRTVASAISGRREFNQPMTGGIKTRLPLRIPNGNNVTTNERSGNMKKRTSGNDGRRGVKRARHHRYQKQSPVNSPVKKRGYGHSSDSDTECSEKRSLHNNMERQRRIDLRNAFDDLRVLVPEVCSKERAAKVVILREAATYCDQLTNESVCYTKQVSELRKQQERLRARVSQLRRSLAAKR